MQYNFYLQIYGYTYWDEASKKYIHVDKSPKYDIESVFHCKYVRMEGISENGDVKNVYTENYAESEELRIYTPHVILHKNNEVSLTLLFPMVNSNVPMDIQDNERQFYDTIKGRKIEYSDTFRQRYLTLILLKKPEVVSEVLYGDTRYRQVKYTFQNVFGSSFNSSQLK